ncbi:hypothetical protein [Roseateles saccharophilus]|uniref:Uncharacterized protein n=1 Tax=Roseateles saccharophilus TaxID=304 RepID=A0A4R3U5R4_ROSSA|nr:hypothetical protein [Roseateles saccharophilus]TCU82739.1 hypothetical protein EV671_106215 [Roseateles saccharophilus]
MNSAAIAQSSPTDCQLAVQARFLGAAAFAIAMSAFEAWLRVPIQPVLDGYLQEILGRTTSLVAALRKLSL